MLIEVIVSHPADAIAAQAAGAHRIELVAAPERGGLTPDPQTVRSVLSATDLPVRVMLRCHEPHVVEPTTIATLTAQLEAARGAGATEFVVGLLTADRHVHGRTFGSLLTELGSHRWTFHRALDDCPDLIRGVYSALTLPGCDTVLVAGHRGGVEAGRASLVRLLSSRSVPTSAVLVGGGLRPDHLARLIRAGARSFHLGRAVRAEHSWSGAVRPDLVAAIVAQIAEGTGHKVAP